MAWLCQQPKYLLNAAAAQFYSEAFAAEPKLAEEVDGHRYNAACTAALAGTAQGKDAPRTEAERIRLRRQALDWLQAELAAYRQQLQKNTAASRPRVLKKMEHWQRDRDFIGVRGAEALAKLPKSERREWENLWVEVAALRSHASQ